MFWEILFGVVFAISLIGLALSIGSILIVFSEIKSDPNDLD
jgi:hypothetical protein